MAPHDVGASLLALVANPADVPVQAHEFGIDSEDRPRLGGLSRAPFFVLSLDSLVMAFPSLPRERGEFAAKDSPRLTREARFRQADEPEAPARNPFHLAGPLGSFFPG